MMPRYLVDHDHDSYREEVTANSAAKAARKVATQEHGDQTILARWSHLSSKREWFGVYSMDGMDDLEVYIVVEAGDE